MFLQSAFVPKVCKPLKIKVFYLFVYLTNCLQSILSCVHKHWVNVVFSWAGCYIPSVVIFLCVCRVQIAGWQPCILYMIHTDDTHSVPVCTLYPKDPLLPHSLHDYNLHVSLLILMINLVNGYIQCYCTSCEDLVYTNVTVWAWGVILLSLGQHVCYP